MDEQNVVLGVLAPRCPGTQGLAVHSHRESVATFAYNAHAHVLCNIDHLDHPQQLKCVHYTHACEYVLCSVV